MLRPFYKFFIILTNLIVSLSVFAGMTDEKNLSFQVNAESLLKGDIQFFAELSSPREIRNRYPELQDIDSLGLIQNRDLKLFLTKSAYIVKRPIGFFDENKFTDTEYLKKLMGPQKVKKISVNSFQISDETHSFNLQRFFDSDDMSTLPDSKLLRAVIGIKRMDIISQSAASIMLSEKTKYTKYAKGGVSISSFIPILENRTLIITYELHGIQKKYALPEVLKTLYKEEIKSLQKNLEQ